MSFSNHNLVFIYIDLHTHTLFYDRFNERMVCNVSFWSKKNRGLELHWNENSWCRVSGARDSFTLRVLTEPPVSTWTLWGRCSRWLERDERKKPWKWQDFMRRGDASLVRDLHMTLLHPNRNMIRTSSPSSCALWSDSEPPGSRCASAPLSGITCCLELYKHGCGLNSLKRYRHFHRHTHADDYFSS